MAQATLLRLLTGAVAVGFHITLDYGEVLRNRIVDLARQQTIVAPWVVMGFALAAGFSPLGWLSVYHRKHPAVEYRI